MMRSPLVPSIAMVAPVLLLGCTRPHEPFPGHTVPCPPGGCETDSGTSDTSDTADPATTPPFTGPSCLAGVVPRLPAVPQVYLGTPKFLDGYGGAFCVDERWSFSANGFADGPFGMDNVLFQAWDLRSGEIVGEFPGDLEYYFDLDARIEWWAADFSATDAFPCADSAHLAWSAGGSYLGEASMPVPALGSSSPGIRTYTDGGDLWEVVVESDASDELWVWVAYPLLREAYGPFPMTFIDDSQPVWYRGKWHWHSDEATQAALGESGAVVTVLGCARGVPIGADAVNPY